MKRKNIAKIALSPDQRSALWASVELLYFLSGPGVHHFDSNLIDMICDAFESLDGNPETVTFSFTAAQHRICCFSLKYALLYLAGELSHFCTPIPELTDSTLQEFSQVIQALTSLFPG